jgi:hypothetical protein
MLHKLKELSAVATNKSGEYQMLSLWTQGAEFEKNGKLKPDN